MFADELINENLTVLSPDISVEDAVAHFEDSFSECLPLVEGQKFLGLVFREKIEELPDYSVPLSRLPLDKPNAYLRGSRHFMDFLEVCLENDSPLAALVDDDFKYLGCASLADLSRFLGRQMAVSQNGVVLVISKTEREFSMAELMRLLEVDLQKVIYAFVHTQENEPGFIKATVKLNSPDATRAAATLERFGYQVIQKFQNSVSPDWDQDRIQLLLKYLSI